MKKVLPHLALALAALLSIFAGIGTAQSQFVPQPYQIVTTYPLATAVTASGAASAVRNVSANKTYQVTSSVGSGTGTAVVTIQGSNDSTNWDNVGTVTLTLSTTPISGSFSSQDRYVWIRPNASTLTGTTATYTVTMGF
jgi:hypothetical protein